MFYAHMGEEAVLEGVKNFGPSAGGEAMINYERQHAEEAMETGIYVTHFNPTKKMECARVGSKSQCFCGHKYSDHNLTCTKKKLANPCQNCICKGFKWMPQRPEECGMYWLPRRKDFKLSEWKAKCKCGHGHDVHSPNGPQKCKKCGCFDFYSDFACISCDGRWEDHETIYEFEHDRLQAGKKVGADFMPLAGMNELQGLIFDPEQRKKLPNNNRPNPKKKAITSNKPNQKPLLKAAIDFSGVREGKGIKPQYFYEEDNRDQFDSKFAVGVESKFRNDGTFKSLVPIDNNSLNHNEKPFPASKNNNNNAYGNDQPFPMPRNYR